MRPFAKNVDGDFYVVDECCTLCGVPESAPTLFAMELQDASGGPGHCWVKRQPETEAEVAKMLDVIGAAELRCVRYRGADADMVARLEAMGEGDQVDR